MKQPKISGTAGWLKIKILKQLIAKVVGEPQSGGRGALSLYLFCNHDQPWAVLLIISLKIIASK